MSGLEKPGNRKLKVCQLNSEALDSPDPANSRQENGTLGLPNASMPATQSPTTSSFGFLLPGHAYKVRRSYDLT